MIDEQEIYLLGMMVNTLVRAMGMMSENLQRVHRNESMAFTQKEFDDLWLETGIHHNTLVEKLYH